MRSLYDVNGIESVLLLSSLERSRLRAGPITDPFRFELKSSAALAINCVSFVGLLLAARTDTAPVRASSDQLTGIGIGG